MTEPLYQPAQPTPGLEPWQKGAFILFLLAWALNEALLFLETGSSPQSQWPEAALLVAGVVSSLITLARRLPVQNVVMTGCLIGLMAGVVMSVAAVSGIPFGPYTYSERMGEKIFSAVPWPVPFIWIVMLVNARGVARLILRPWRKTNYYGYWVIGWAAMLAVLLDLSLEPFAVSVKHYWIWHAPKWVWAWYSAPWVNFMAWLLTALGILVFTTPWLINKNPVKLPMDYQPLILWLLLNVWLISGNLLHQLWLAAAVGLAGNVIAAVFTIRGARW